MLQNKDPKKRRSVRQIREYLARQKYKAMREFNDFDAATPTTKRIRNSERLAVLQSIAEFVGDVRELESKSCLLIGCNTKVFDLGGNKKYCSNACRQKAYRLRKKMRSI